MKSIKPLLGLALLLPGLALSAESGTALKNDTLRKEPYADAKAVGTLKRSEKVEILARKGAWLQVKTRAGSGWVRLLSVKRGAAGSSGEAAAVLGLATGRAGTGQVVSTTGVRGLSEEELKSARFSEDEVKLLESYTVSAADGRKFADAGSLRPRRVEFLPAPQAAAQEGAK